MRFSTTVFFRRGEERLRERALLFRRGAGSTGQAGPSVSASPRGGASVRLCGGRALRVGGTLAGAGPRLSVPGRCGHVAGGPYRAPLPPSPGAHGPVGGVGPRRGGAFHAGRSSPIRWRDPLCSAWTRGRAWCRAVLLAADLAGPGPGARFAALGGVAAASWAGSLAVLLLILVVASRVRSGTVLLILGLMFGQAVNSLVTVLLHFSSAQRAHGYLAWSFGSFSSTSWPQVATMALGILPALLAGYFLPKPLTALLLGERYARTLGVPVERVRMGLIGVTAFLSGSVTAFWVPSPFWASPRRTSAEDCCAARITGCFCPPASRGRWNGSRGGHALPRAGKCPASSRERRHLAARRTRGGLGRAPAPRRHVMTVPLLELKGLSVGYRGGGRSARGGALFPRAPGGRPSRPRWEKRHRQEHAAAHALPSAAPLGGEMFLRGRPFSEWHRGEFARRVSAVLSEREIAPDMTVFDLVALGRHPHTDWRGHLRRRTGPRWRTALSVLRMSHFRNRSLFELSDGSAEGLYRPCAGPRTGAASPGRAHGLSRPAAQGGDGNPSAGPLPDAAHDRSRGHPRHFLGGAFRGSLWLLADEGTLLEGAPEDLVLSGALDASSRRRRSASTPFSGRFFPSEACASAVLK
jgi:hypothetical protein